MLENFPRKRALALLLCLALPASAWALETPRSSRLDHRVRYVNYDPANVIQLDAVIGVATHIMLEPGETYQYHVFGDSQAYAFTYKNHHLFFKPTAEDADTNLIVITDRREYSFRLSYSHDRSAPALYKLVMRYPEVEARMKAQAAQKAAVERSLQASAGTMNWQAYTRSGNWLQFPPETDMPTVYRVTPDGQEVITNHHMADERTMVLHRTSPRWHLRLGNQVLAIHNEAFGLTPVPAHTGTASPAVRRTVKGATAPVPTLRIREITP